MNNQSIRREDWTLLVIAAAHGEALTPVQLQKCLFLLEKENPQEIEADYYQFEAYDYGPFSSAIYRDAEALENEGFVVIKYASHGRWKEYRATPAGMERAGALRQLIEPELVNSIDEIVTWGKSRSFRELVRAIYDQYPEYRANSVFQD